MALWKKKITLEQREAYMEQLQSAITVAIHEILRVARLNGTISLNCTIAIPRDGAIADTDTALTLIGSVSMSGIEKLAQAFPAPVAPDAKAQMMEKP